MEDVNQATIQINNLQFSYTGDEIIVSIKNLTIRNNSIVAVLGPSGCGKTTLLGILGGLLPVNNEAQIYLSGLGIKDAIKKGHINISFQTPVLMPWLNVVENTSLPLLLKGKEVIHQNIYSALKRVHLLDPVRNFYPEELSSGMRSRVAVAQALISGANILLMDEVFGTLDEATRAKMNIMLREINNSEMNSTIIFVTHSIEEALLLSDRVLILKKPEYENSASILYDQEIDLPKRTPAIRYLPEFLKLKESLEKIILKENLE
jgi:ABC-type nitrate/sulfonate/bicarbonate transport system ATPase subunit